MCGRRAEAERFVEEAIAVLQTAPPGPELAWAYSHQSQLDMLASRMDSAIAWGERALELARKLGQKEVIIHALGNIGSAKADDVGSGTCVELEQSFELAVDHFDLFGLKQVWRRLSNRSYRAPVFRTPSLYKLVRHPLYIGWLTIFWAAPTMTVAHLIFALATTAYILIAIRLEERDLVCAFGNAYVDYRARTPMLIPRLWSRRNGRIQREIS